jgi:4-oxalocrotonate tautomerase family enzyme
MVVIVVHTIEGKTKEARKEIIEGITEIFVRQGVKPESIRVVINEIAASSWGTGGKPVG